MLAQVCRLLRSPANNVTLERGPEWSACLPRVEKWTFCLRLNQKKGGIGPSAYPPLDAWKTEVFRSLEPRRPARPQVDLT